MEWQAWTTANPSLQYLFSTDASNPLLAAQRHAAFETWDAQAGEASHYLQHLADHCDATMLPIITKGILLRALVHSQEYTDADPPLCDPNSLPACKRQHPDASAALAFLGNPNKMTTFDFDAEDSDIGTIQQTITAIYGPTTMVTHTLDIR